MAPRVLAVRHPLLARLPRQISDAAMEEAPRIAVVGDKVLTHVFTISCICVIE
jgi:hypothetical protein